MNQVDGKYVPEEEREDLEREELLDQRAELYQCLQSKGEDDAIELRDVVLGVSNGSGEHDWLACRYIRVDAVFVGCIVDTGPLGQHVNAQPSKCCDGTDQDQWVVEERSGVQSFSIPEVDFEVRE